MRISHCVRRQLAPKREVFFLLFWVFFLEMLCLSCISHPGNRLFSHSYEKIGLSSYFIFLLSTYSDLWSHLISFLSLCMFCLRMSSLSCSQAYNSAQPDQSFHFKTFYPWATERMAAPIITLRTLSVCHSVVLHDSTLSMHHRSYMGIRYAHLKILFFGILTYLFQCLPA